MSEYTQKVVPSGLSWARRAARAGVIGLLVFAVISAAQAATAQQQPAQAEAAGATVTFTGVATDGGGQGTTTVVSVTCTGTVLLVERAEDQPSSKLRITTATNASCSSPTNPAIVAASVNGFATFTGTCIEVAGGGEGTVRFYDSAGVRIFQSVVEGGFAAATTGDGGVSVTVQLAEVTSGDFTGAAVAAATTTVAGTNVSCLTGTSPQSVDMNADGAAAG